MSVMPLRRLGTFCAAMVLLSGALFAAESPRRRPLPPNRWPDLITQRQYERLMGLVIADVSARKLTPSITPDGLMVREPPFASSTFGLGDLVQKVRLAPDDQWPLVVREHFDSLIQTVEDDAKLQEKLKKAQNALPLLAVRIYGERALAAEVLAADVKKDLIWRIDIEGTITVLVLDLPTSLRSVSRDQVKGWGINEQDLFARALDNEAQNVQVTEEELALPGGVKLIGLTSNNLLTSSRALLLRHHPKALGKAGALVGVPTRHIVLAHPINDQSAATAMKSMIPMIINLEREGPGSTSDKLYWYREGKFTVIPARADAEGVTVRPPDELMGILKKLPPASSDNGR